MKQQLAETRQELSNALYYNDSAERVIARLQKERDDARDALSRIQVSGGANGVENGHAMQVDGQSLPDSIIAKIEETQSRLQGTRRKRPVPEDWATAERIQSFDATAKIDSQFTGVQTLVADESGDLLLCGDSDGDVGVYDLQAGAFTTRSNIGAGAVTSAAWARDRSVIATSSGAVVITQGGSVEEKFHQHAGAATAVAAHPCGEIVASVGADKSYVLYDLQNSKVLTQIFTDSGMCHLNCLVNGPTNADPALTTVAFHPDGHLLCVGNVQGAIQLFDVKSNQLMHTFEPAAGSTSPVQALQFSENGTWLASANLGESNVYVWDLRKTSLLKTLEVGQAVMGIAWDYTGQFLAACGLGGVVVNSYAKSSKAWSEVLKKAVGGVAVAWGAKAGSLVVTTGDGTVSVLSG